MILLIIRAMYLHLAKNLWCLERGMCARMTFSRMSMVSSILLDVRLVA